MRELVIPSTSHLPLDRRLATALAELMAAARGDAASLFVLEHGNELVCQLSAGRHSAGGSKHAMRWLELVRRVATTGRAQIDERSDADPTGGSDAVAAIGLPLFDGATLVGVAAIEYRMRPELGADVADRLAQPADHLAALARLRVTAGVEQDEPGARERPDLDALKANFLSMVSHELRTPLTAIIGYTDLLIRQVHGTLSSRQLQHQLAVRKAADRLLNLINDLLDVTRLESGLVAIEQRPIPLGRVVTDVVREARLSARRQEISLRDETPDDLPTVIGDEARLRQILANLLDNAIKFTPAGGVVTVRGRREGDTVRLEVADTGIGVPSDQIDRIWDRLHQADSGLRRRYGGSGLGLALVRLLAELHGGSVNVESAGPDRGSTFSISLPIGVAGEAAERVGATGPAPARRGRARLRILIVDDDLDSRDVVASIVSDVLGHDVLLAADGPQGISRAVEQPDLILLDLRMPEMDGVEVARRLSAMPETRAIPIVALTALDDQANIEAALAAGCLGYITKPFTAAKLGDVIARALRRESRIAITV